VNLVDFSITQNPQNPDDYIVTGIITDDNNLELGNFGVNGTSIFVWWAEQDSEFQINIANQFATIMAQQIVQGTAE
jgi:hypothetical protein